MEKCKSLSSPPPLPPRILILLDRLSNVQFSQLTRKQLKDQVEELKTALIEEFSKLKPTTERPQPSSANPPADLANRTRVINKPPHPPSTTTKCPPPKDIRKEEKKSEQRYDQKSDLKKDGSSRNKNTPAPAKPSYAELLRLAESVKNQKEPSPLRANSRERVANTTTQEIRKNGSHDRKTSNHNSSSHRSPSRSRAGNEVPRRDAMSNVASSNSNQHKDRYSSSSRRDGDSRRTGELKSSNRPPSSSEQKRSLPPTSRTTDDKLRNSAETKNEPKKGREPKKSKKAEEDEILERKRQKIREENERVRLRNEVLAGKRSATDLKSIVKNVSHGNTVLSCRPASSTSNRNGPSTFGRPLVGRTDDEMRHRRPPSGREFLDDYDDEEDEDMDSFIDDDEGRAEESDNPDVSKAIRDIFGYDKRKYVGMDEDIEEASYSQIMKEEARSQRIGREEDLADMREEMRQKKLKKERLKQLQSR